MKYNFECPIEGFQIKTAFGMKSHFTYPHIHLAAEHSEWIVKQLGKMPSNEKEADDMILDLIRRKCKIENKP